MKLNLITGNMAKKGKQSEQVFDYEAFEKEAIQKLKEGKRF